MSTRAFQSVDGMRGKPIDCDASRHDNARVSGYGSSDREAPSPWNRDTNVMVQVVFTSNLQRHVACPTARVTGSTVAEALECVFSENPALRRYVLDDQGALRKNMVIFVDGCAMKDRCTLGDRLDEDAEIFVMQALTGG